MTPGASSWESQSEGWLLSIKDLRLRLPIQGGGYRLVLESVTFSIAEGEIVGLCGPSGCGKSQTAMGLIGLWPIDAQSDGCICWRGTGNLLKGPEKQWRELRGSAIALVSQDPLASMNPLLTVGRHLEEVLRTDEGSKERRRKRGLDLLAQVALPQPELLWVRYPNELSGGQRQRVMLAAAIARSPRLLIADEPTTSLDVSVQAKILRLLLDLRDRLGLAILLISHDKSVIGSMCDRVIRMERGVARSGLEQRSFG